MGAEATAGPLLYDPYTHLYPFVSVEVQKCSVIHIFRMA